MPEIPKQQREITPAELLSALEKFRVLFQQLLQETLQEVRQGVRQDMREASQRVLHEMQQEALGSGIDDLLRKWDNDAALSAARLAEHKRAMNSPWTGGLGTPTFHKPRFYHQMRGSQQRTQF